MTAHALMADFDQTRPVRPWLFGIAYRLVLRHRRRLGRAHELRGDAPEVADPRPTAEHELSARATEALVAKAIDAIELSRRAVFIMKEIDGHDVPEIARTLDIPLNTAYSRLRLARDEFRAAVLRERRAGRHD